MKDKNLKILEDFNNYKEMAINLLSIDKIKYKILNPGGNKTALVIGCEYNNIQKEIINKKIMEKHLEVEQVGFLSTKTNRLEMAGGEFCINGARCAIFEYLKGKKGKVEISVSGTNKKIIGKILNNRKVEAKLNINKNLFDLIETKRDFTCVNLNGILIAVLDEEKSKQYIKKLERNEEVTKTELKQLMKKEIDAKEKAIGIILLEKVLKNIKIHPIIWVNNIDTILYETSCGSGSLGTAIYNYFKNEEEKIELIQPSGYNIAVKLEINKRYVKSATISGIVKEE